MPAVGKGAPAASADGAWVITGHDRAELESFDQMMRPFMHARSITGAALAVTRDSRLVHARGYTYRGDDGEDLLVEPTSLFRIASISKPITAVAVLRLVQDRQLDLHARLTDILSLAPPPGEVRDRALPSVTVLNLLQHLGGWDRDRTFDPMYHDIEIADALDVLLPITKGDIATFMTGQPLQYTPGTRYSYSNYGYNLLGQIIEAVTGMSYYHYVGRAVFHPLGITRPILGRTLYAHRFSGEVKYHTQRHSRSVTDNCGARVPSSYGGFNMEHRDANGGWLASAVDLVRFASTFDRPATSPVLNPESVRRMFGLPENLPRSSYTPGDSYYGCGWRVRDYGAGARNTWHGGGFAGTKAILTRRWRRSPGTNYCVLFNRGEDPSGLDYNDIYGQLTEAANAVTTWPDDDLFDEYL